MDQDIGNIPGFFLRVPYIIWKIDFNIVDANSNVRKSTHKHGIDVPSSAYHTKKIDESNGKTLWMDAINNYMETVFFTSDTLEPVKHIPVGWQKFRGYIIFDVKMDLTRK